MDTFMDISKSWKHLIEPSTCKELNSDPIQAVRNDVLSTLDILPNTHQIDDKIRNYLTPPKLALTPLFYSLRKVHKLNIPL